MSGDAAAVRVRVRAAPFALQPTVVRLECTRTSAGWRISTLVEYPREFFAR